MLTIHKFPFEEGTDKGGWEYSIHIPSDAVVVDFKFQNGVPTMWVLLDTNKSTLARRFLLIETGNPIQIKEPLTPIGSAMTEEGEYVIHLFEIDARAQARNARPFSGRPFS